MAYEVEDFDKDVLQRSHQVPVLVDFWAPWCAPCRALGPVVERLATEATGRWVLVKVNTEERPDLAMAFDIRSIPCLKLFHQGRVADSVLGALPEDELRRWLARTLPSPYAEVVARARSQIESGEVLSAAALLDGVLKADPTQAEARLLLARCLLGAAPERVFELLEPLGPDSEFATLAEATRTLARFTLLAEHPDRLADAPVKPRYLEGARAIKLGDYAAALEAFLEVLERQRNYARGGAKEACRAIFQFLGPRHPIVERYHRAFSSTVHA